MRMEHSVQAIVNRCATKNSNQNDRKYALFFCSNQQHSDSAASNASEHSMKHQSVLSDRRKRLSRNICHSFCRTYRSRAVPKLAARPIRQQSNTMRCKMGAWRLKRPISWAITHHLSNLMIFIHRWRRPEQLPTTYKQIYAGKAMTSPFFHIGSPLISAQHFWPH